MPNGDEYQRAREQFDQQQIRLRQDAEFNEKISRVAAFLKCEPHKVLDYLRARGHVPLDVMLKVPDLPKEVSDPELVDLAIASMDRTVK